MLTAHAQARDNEERTRRKTSTKTRARARAHDDDKQLTVNKRADHLRAILGSDGRLRVRGPVRRLRREVRLNVRQRLAVRA